MQSTKTLALMFLLVAMVACTAQAGLTGCYMEPSEKTSKCVNFQRGGHVSCEACCKKSGCKKDFGPHNNFACHCS